ncbi:MAG: hypothetical protein LBT44_04310 [Clostridiales bacterium]|jgi:hypothetical protein|nr:hypothetical protein [Clostridiales bacterium]
MIKRGFLFSLLVVLLGTCVWTQAGFGAHLERIAAFQGSGLKESLWLFLDRVTQPLGHAASARRMVSGVSLLLKMIICLGISWFHPLPFRRGGSFVLHRPLRVVGYGIFGYAAFLALILVFTFSVLGLPLAVLFFILCWLLTTMGEIALGLAAGFLLCDSLRIKASINTYTLFGVLSIEISRRMPYLGYWVSLLLLPIMCVGLIVTVVYEGYLKKNFCDLSIWTDGENKQKRQKTKETILKGFEKKGFEKKGFEKKGFEK